MNAAINPAVRTSPEYRRFIEDLKARVISARICAARAVNRNLILLYWDIGRGIVDKQQTLGWGDSVVEMVAADLRRAFPASHSFSPDNLWRMRQFYLAYSTSEFLGRVVPEKQLAASLGAQPAILGQAVPETRPTIVDAGGGPNPTLDLLADIPWGQNLLLFYHRFLRALVAFDLKVGPFEPEYAGKMDFYLNLLNDKERVPDDNLSIGIILCAEKDDIEVEYALRAKRNPIGVAVYQLQSKLPADLKGKLPTAKQLADAVRTVLPEKNN